MKLLTKALEKELPALYSTDGTGELEDRIAHVKYFHPFSNWTWYGVEYSPDERLFFGLVDGSDAEWGNFSLAELESLTFAGLGVERDLHFKPTRIGDLKLVAAS